MMPPPPPPTTIRPTWKASSSTEGEALPTNNLWIGNLAPEVSEADLIELFSKYGPIDSITNYSYRTYAFVHFKKVEDAKAAKDKIQGTIIHGNPIKIEFAKPAKPCKSLWVAGISQSVSKDELEEEFNKFGKIQEFKFLRDRSTAYVDYFRLEDASQALKSMNGKRIGGDVIRVDFLRSQPSRREQGADYRDTRDGQSFNWSIAPPSARWIPEDSFKAYSEPIFDGYKLHQFFSPAGRHGEGQPSKVLWIRYPPSVRVDEDMLHNAMILFGEIESIKTYEDRNYAFVQFRSVDEARLAKQGLQGKLFSDPRISIEYSNNELAPPNESFGGYAELNRPIPDILPSEVPLGQGQMDLFVHEQKILAPRGIIRPDAMLRQLGTQGGFEPGYANSELDDLALVNKLQDGNRHTLLGGPNWRQSPVPGMLTSSSNGLRPQNISSGPWDMVYATQHLRESKRPRVDGTLPPYDALFPPKRVDEPLGSDDPLVNFEGRKHLSPLNSRSLATAPGQRRPDNDYVWRGVIAKGGTPICRARCVPIGEGIGSEIPDVVNCTARTGLDMLTKHYADAVGFHIVFFLPDSEADFAPYTEFLRYLESKRRAGVAKFEDGTTLFLVPPSDFLTKVLKVTGPERLYGVVLEFPQTAPSGASNQPQYVGLQPQNTSQTGNNGMPQDESTLQMNYNTSRYDGVKAPLKAPAAPNPVLPVDSAAVTQPAVPLTPELIATLASLLPASNKLSGAVEVTSSVLGPTINNLPNQDQVIAQTWIDRHQVPEHGAHPAHQLSKLHSQAQFAPLPYQPISSTPSLSNQMPVGYCHGQDHVFNLRSQAVVSSREATSASPLLGQVTVFSHLDQQSDGMRQGTDPMRYFGSSVLQQSSNGGTLVGGTNSSNVQHLHGHLALGSDTDMNNQMQLLKSAMHGVSSEVSETEDEKNRRYQTTLLFAANLLSKVQQPPEKQIEQGSGSH